MSWVRRGSLVAATAHDHMLGSKRLAGRYCCSCSRAGFAVFAEWYAAISWLLCRSLVVIAPRFDWSATMVGLIGDD